MACTLCHILSTYRNDNGEDIFVHQVLCNLCTVHWAIQLHERLLMCVIVLTLSTDSSSSIQLSSLLWFHNMPLSSNSLLLPMFVCSTNISLPLLHYCLLIPSILHIPPTYLCLSSRRLSSRTTPTSICAVLAMERQWNSLWSRVPKDQKQPRSRVQTELPSRGVNMHVSQYADSTCSSIPDPCPCWYVASLLDYFLYFSWSWSWSWPLSFSTPWPTSPSQVPATGQPGRGQWGQWRYVCVWLCVVHMCWCLYP